MSSLVRITVSIREVDKHDSVGAQPVMIADGEFVSPKVDARQAASAALHKLADQILDTALPNHLPPPTEPGL